MPTVLIVDDSPVDQALAGALLADEGSFTVLTASNGKEALAQLAESTIDLVVTDMQMEEMNGLELVEAVRQRYPATPVVLMTAHGSEELAAQALRRGAASYVAKRSLAADLVETATQVLRMASADRDLRRAADCLDQAEVRFVLTNDLATADAVISYLREQFTQLRFFDDNELMRVGVALKEALVNAIVHGNLEITADAKQGDAQAYQRQLVDRQRAAPFSGRRVVLTVKIDPEQVTITVQDEGTGFDPSNLLDPFDPAQSDVVTGRGLVLIRAFMETVYHNTEGNAITMIKNRSA